MKINQRVQILACSAVLFLATLLKAGAGDSASLVSQTIPTNTVVAPGQTFTQTWTLQNTGTTPWPPGAGGYRLMLAGTDSLGIIPLSTNTISTRYHPYATLSGISWVAPGVTATFSLCFIAPQTPGTYADTFQMVNLTGTLFGPQVGVQIVVQQAGAGGPRTTAPGPCRMRTITRVLSAVTDTFGRTAQATGTSARWHQFRPAWSVMIARILSPAALGASHTRWAADLSFQAGCLQLTGNPGPPGL